VEIESPKQQKKPPRGSSNNDKWFSIIEKLLTDAAEGFCPLSI
jgi:hypothetical protein